MTATDSSDRWLPGVPREEMEKTFQNAPGDEIGRGKFDNPTSSAALAANAFGFFLHRADALPPLPGCGRAGWPAGEVRIEETLRFPWRGGRHPVLDVLVITPTALIGVESKRFEPFRETKAASFSSAYWRPVWGARMKGYEGVRDALRQNPKRYERLDAAQLVKHAFGLRTQVQTDGAYPGRKPILFYVYAEPESWPDGGGIEKEKKARHREEIAAFAKNVEGDEAAFVSCSWGALLAEWRESANSDVRAHAENVLERYAP